MEDKSHQAERSLSGLNLNLKKVAGAFFSDEKLQRILTGPLLIPHDLNTINTKFIGPSKLSEDESVVLDGLISKLIPQEINRETILTSEGVSNLRKLSLLVNLAYDLHGQSNLEISKLLADVGTKLSQSELDSLISSEEMYRIRNHKMDLNVVNFPQKIVEDNQQLKLEPAYDKFVQSIKSGKTVEQTAKLLNDEYPDEHTKVEFVPAQVSGLKPVYGLNGC